MRWKSCGHRSGGRGAGVLCVLSLLAGGASAQTSRITRAIDNQQRTVLKGHIHPKAQPEYDRGRVSPSQQLPYVTLRLAPSSSQQADLNQLLEQQQTAGSANYHHWLTPEDFAQRFGASQEDVDKITAWLGAQGLTVAAVARARNWIAVNGAASNIESAFQTEIHEYSVNGEAHFANATEPSVPTAFGEVVSAIRGLNDFRMKPKRRRGSALAPHYTDGQGNYFIAPDDFATIYDVKPLYADGIDGSGQSLVIAGQTNINLSDIETFRSTFGLSANDPQLLLVPNSQDPGISQSDLDEADLDLELSGAVARNAKIIFVYSSDVMVSVEYAIDQDLAPVLSQSYGGCEQETPTSDALSFQEMGQQANAEGMTWFAASGDDGAADCDDNQNSGLAVDLPGAVPNVTSMGGSEFQEGSGQYWATNGAALSYIPETSWNDSVEDGTPSASGGGASIYFTKPSWQTGPGVPNDNARDVPDLALSASADHDGYLVYTGGQMQVYGGTSVAAPSFAGVAVLLNQYLVSIGAQSAGGLGNMNPKLYSLAQTAPGAFHDITTGNNIVTVPCMSRHFGCSNVAVGFNAGVGYDQVTGLGSVDVDKLIAAWSGKAISSPVSTSSTTSSITLLSNLRTVVQSDAVSLIATVTGASGATPAGTVQFSVGGVSLGTATLVGSGGSATATLVVNGSELPLGSGTITAVYNEGNSSSVTASVTVSVSATASTSNGTPSIAGIANGASFQHIYSPGMLLAVFGSQLAPSATAASSVPLPVSTAGIAATVNGVAAPLYYVSPGQLNIQIPYQTPVNTPVTLSINNNGLVTSYPFTVVPAAPGIFTDETGGILPDSSGAPGTVASIYLTGAGTVNPAIATGAAPVTGTLVENLPQPTQAVAVYVDGVQAVVQFVGIPWGLVGVTQVNFTVPNVAAGAQSVIVTVGGVASPAGRLTIF